MIEGYAPFELGKRAPVVRMRLWICGPLCCGGREAWVTNLTILLCCSYSCTRLQYTVLCGTAVTQAPKFGFGAQNKCPINRLVRASIGGCSSRCNRLTRLGVTVAPPHPPIRFRQSDVVVCGDARGNRENISYTAVHVCTIKGFITSVSPIGIAPHSTCPPQPCALRRSLHSQTPTHTKAHGTCTTSTRPREDNHHNRQREGGWAALSRV